MTVECPRCGIDYEPADGNFGPSPVHNGIHTRVPSRCDCVGQKYGGHERDCPRREAEPFA